MEGLIPYLVHALKKEKPKHSYRSFSDNSSVGRSYHRLLSESSSSHQRNFAAAAEGSSHRRTRSEFQQPLPNAIGNFLERRSRSVKASGAADQYVGSSAPRRNIGSKWSWKVWSMKNNNNYNNKFDLLFVCNVYSQLSMYMVTMWCFLFYFFIF